MRGVNCILSRKKCECAPFRARAGTRRGKPGTGSGGTGSLNAAIPSTAERPVQGRRPHPGISADFFPRRKAQARRRT